MGYRLLSLVVATAAHAQNADAFRLNQVGFYPDGPKAAVVVGAEAGAFAVKPAGGGEGVLTGTLGGTEAWAASGETVRLADSSELTSPGEYEVEVDGVGASYPFQVGGYVHQEVAWGALKAYYFMRASAELATASDVTVRVFGVLGREVARPLDAAPRGAGGNVAGVDGSRLPSGVYVVRVETPAAAASRTLTLVR